MNQEDLKKIAKKHFDANANLSELFITEDGNSFTDMKYARRHKARTGKNISTFTRKMFTKAKNEPVTPPTENTQS